MDFLLSGHESDDNDKFACEEPVVIFTGTFDFLAGGSSGIGLELARLAAKEGAKVTIVARNEERLKEAVASLESPDAS